MHRGLVCGGHLTPGRYRYWLSGPVCVCVSNFISSLFLPFRLWRQCLSSHRWWHDSKQSAQDVRGDAMLDGPGGHGAGSSSLHRNHDNRKLPIAPNFVWAREKQTFQYKLVAIKFTKKLYLCRNRRPVAISEHLSCDLSLSDYTIRRQRPKKCKDYWWLNDEN